MGVSLGSSATMGIVDRIKEIGGALCWLLLRVWGLLLTLRCWTEDEMKRTQKNKATEGHLGFLKAKLAKLRTEVSAESRRIILQAVG